jgi:hypothetical protein
LGLTQQPTQLPIYIKSIIQILYNSNINKRHSYIIIFKQSILLAIIFKFIDASNNINTLFVFIEQSRSIIVVEEDLVKLIMLQL